MCSCYHTDTWNKRQKRGNLWLHFPVSYSTRSTCKDHYPQENPAALKSLCKLNHIQTSGAEFCCCAQGMEISVGDMNWMFFEYHESRIIEGTQNAFPATFCSLPERISTVMWLGWTYADIYLFVHILWMALKQWNLSLCANSYWDSLIIFHFLED